jgi:hypothetical protein
LLQATENHSEKEHSKHEDVFVGANLVFAQTPFAPNKGEHKVRPYKNTLQHEKS